MQLSARYFVSVNIHNKFQSIVQKPERHSCQDNPCASSEDSVSSAALSTVESTAMRWRKNSATRSRHGHFLLHSLQWKSIQLYVLIFLLVL